MGMGWIGMGVEWVWGRSGCGVWGRSGVRSGNGLMWGGKMRGGSWVRVGSRVWVGWVRSKVWDLDGSGVGEG